jgi:hypothetical protein
MALALQAVIGTTVYSLTDGNPFRLESAEGLGAPPISRLGEQSPLQNAVTDLGYRIEPRTVTLALNFSATTDAALDACRSTLGSVFRPVDGIPIYLRAIRNDGGTRQLTCYPVGEHDIPIVPLNRPGHLHRTVVQLRADDPLWYAPTESGGGGTVALLGSAVPWWTANGLIGSANVVEYGEYPAQGQQWTYGGTITGAWTIAVRTGPETGSGTKTAFAAGTGINSVRLGWSDTALRYMLYGGTPVILGTIAADPFDGVNNVIVNWGAVNGTITFGTAFANGTVQNVMLSSESFNADIDGPGTARRWRSNSGTAASSYWTSEMPKYAIYNRLLTAGEITALDSYMGGTPVLGTISVVNSGDADVYPVITMRGPLSDPVLTNLANGKVIDMRGTAIGPADAWIIDLRTGDKQIIDSRGSSQLAAISGSFYDFVSWALSPAPTATGGTNSIRVQGGSTSVTTRIDIMSTPRYWSL